MELAYSTVRTAVEDPMNAMRELVAKDHAVTNPFHIVPAAQPVQFNTASWYARQIGNTLGALPWFLALGKGVSTVIGESEGITASSAMRVGVARAAATGMLYQGLLTPANQPGSNFWATRAENALTGAVTFATIRGSAGVLGNAEELTKSTALARPTALAVGGLSGMAGGLASAEVGSIARTGHGASAGDLKQAAVGSIALGIGMHAIGSTFSPRVDWSAEPKSNIPSQRVSVAEATEDGASEKQAKPSAPSEDTSKQADVNPPAAEHPKTKTPWYVNPDAAKTLASGNVDQTYDVESGSWAKSLKLGSITDADGKSVGVHLRALKDPDQPWNPVKLENGSIAYDLNQRAGYPQPTPAIAARTLSIDGEPFRDYIVEELMHGQQLDMQLSKWATEKYGDDSEEHVIDLVKSTPGLKNALEAAFVERHVNGNFDFNAANFMAERFKNPNGDYDYTVSNIDWKRSFTDRSNTSWGQEVMQYPVQQLSKIYAGQPLSPELATKVTSLVDSLNDNDPIAQRLGSAETAALKSRGQSLATQGFPQSYWIFDPEFERYKTEIEDADKFWRAKYPQMWSGNSQ